MAEQINRESIITSLDDRYNAWANKAKIPEIGNRVDTRNDWSNNFAARAKKGVTQYTDKALNYSDTMGLNKTKYGSSPGLTSR